MALILLTTASMIMVTEAWGDPARERPVIAKYPRLLPWLDDIDKAHRALHEAQAASDIQPELKRLTEKATALDAEHDRLARGIHQTITGMAELTFDNEQSAALLQLRDELFPSGRSIINRSYLDQAGEASLMESRLSLPSRHLLAHVPVLSSHLGEYVHAWKEVAIELGDVERERIHLTRDQKDESATSIGKARKLWVNAVSAFRYVLDRERELSAADRRRILEPLDTALAKATAKRRASTKSKELASEAED